MKKLGVLLLLLVAAQMAWCQAIYDPKCITLMDAPLEGTDSAFVPALKSVGFVRIDGEDDEDTYVFKGDYYGIKDAKLEVTVNEKTKMLSEATVVLIALESFMSVIRNICLVNYSESGATSRLKAMARSMCLLITAISAKASRFMRMVRTPSIIIIPTWRLIIRMHPTWDLRALCRR